MTSSLGKVPALGKLKERADVRVKEASEKKIPIPAPKKTLFYKTRNKDHESESSVGTGPTENKKAAILRTDFRQLLKFTGLSLAEGKFRITLNTMLI